ncbi:hypothetical protein D9758_013854 [Tetrapyrgos nigripes]|uniref:Cytochrome P450 n=1 Tax=Tetrapyrgos nigripes TaxID=182062 RepID=A0A8H5CRF1_9AGAR|nr:hypothetical protein D9758_013854 [Tetrapyrgos nigripes]
MPTQFESLALFGMSRLALTTMVAAAFFYALAYLCSRLLLKLRSPMPYPYPPGPPAPSLILGHFGRLPMKKPWLAYMEMAKTYGDLIYFRSLKEHIIILNSHEAANDLLEKQARFTSDRPFGYALDSYVGWNDVVTLMCYSDRWRKARRTSHQNLSPEAVLKYRIIQVEKVHQFLQRLISSPSSGEIFHLIGRVSQSIMMSAIYGLNLEITSESKQDDTAQAARDIDDFGDRLLLPGGNTYKSIPFIHYLPFIFPFLPFSRMENSAKTTLKALKDEPFEASMKAWASGSSSSLVGQLVSEAKIRYRDEGKSEYLAEIESIKSMGLTALAGELQSLLSFL